jgi:chromosome segregation ATPase
MNKRFSIIPVLVIGLLTLSLTGFNQKSATAKQAAEDTIPTKNKERKIRNLDEAIDEVDRGFEELNKVNMEKIKREIEESMKNINTEKMKLEMDKAMREVDMAKMKVDLEKALKDVDSEKMKAEIEKSLAKVDMEKIKKELEANRMNMAKVEEELKKIHPQIEKSMKDARESLEKAKAELKEYKTFINDLEKDGWIDTKSEYTIKSEGGALYINGKKQSDDLYRKYQSFLEKHKDFTIEKSEDNFNIHKNK